MPWHTLVCKSVISLHCSVPEIIPHAIYLLSAGLNTSIALKGSVFFKHLQCFFFLVLNFPFIDILTKRIINLFIVKASNSLSKWICNKCSNMSGRLRSWRPATGTASFTQNNYSEIVFF